MNHNKWRFTPVSTLIHQCFFYLRDCWILGCLTFSNCFCCVDTEESVLSSSDTLCFDDCRRLFNSSASAAQKDRDEGTCCWPLLYMNAGIKRSAHLPDFCRAACCVYCNAVCSSDFSDTSMPIVWMWTLGEESQLGLYQVTHQMDKI